MFYAILQQIDSDKIIEVDDTYRIFAERVIGWHGACTNVAVIGTKRRSKS
jgi:hypothetical protein